MMNLILTLLLTYIASSAAIVGYDCGSRTLNVTTLSLINVGECEVPKDAINVKKQYIQLLQINEFEETEVLQCKIEITRTVYHCGMHSHVSIVENGISSYIQELSHETCQNIHMTGSYRYNARNIIYGLRVNHTISHGLTLAGTLDSTGYCTGESYHDPYGTWSKVVVQGIVKITLQRYTAKISLDNNKIHLRSGTVCSLLDRQCMDNEGGYTFWNPLPVDTCKFNQYSILYEGFANKMIDGTQEEVQTVYSLTAGDVTFALTTSTDDTICGYTVFRTEHPKLLIFETSRGETFARNRKISVANLDLFAYVNSKFVYVEKHIRTELRQLYRDVIVQRCNLERQTMKNALAIATQSPDEFAFHLMKGPGYMAVVAGEVVHIVKCIPIEVRVQQGKECFNELQVEWKNSTYFITPRTHILKRRGTLINCNPLLPSYYFIGETWYKIMPRPIETTRPNVLRPNSQPTWKYTNPADLAKSGLYSDADLKTLRDHIMFPVERPSYLNEFVREMTGRTITDKDGTIFKLLNEETVTKLAETFWNKTWSKFITFGTISAGVIAIFMIIQTFKIILDILIRGYTLHSIFGWSLKLVAAVWDSITHYLLHNHHQQARNQQPEREAVELMPQNPAPENVGTAPKEPSPYQILSENLPREETPGNVFNLRVA